MKRIRKSFVWPALLAVGIPLALVWWSSPLAHAQQTFEWKGLTWTDYERGKSVVYQKVGGDTAYFNVYENAAPGVEVGDNQPGDCNATDGYRGVLWYDTSGADSGLKWCNNEDGSYNWDPMAQADEIKAGVMALGTTGTLPFLQNRTFTGTDLERMSAGNIQRYLQGFDSRYCLHTEDGRATVVSSITETINTRGWNYGSDILGDTRVNGLGLGNRTVLSSITCNGYYN